ncbi:MAG: TM0106 family RecB-like putative nuclease [Cyanobacteriota bacterium]|nr:TM0106 family RecB-like putative nuclease [Cyanobacteriota bacterium]
MPREELTDRLLRSWIRCRRRSWLDRHGDPAERRWTAHRALALSDQHRSFESLLPLKPARGEEAAAAGAASVMGLRLRGQIGAMPIAAHPVLLERVPGRSIWGAHAYRPVLGRQGRNLTREHRLQLALWGRLLAGHQGAPVPHALVLAGSGSELQRERLALSPALQRQLDESVQRLAGDLQRSTPPPLVADRRKCVLCSWRGFCNREAQQAGHLSEVSGIGGKRRELLLGLGIETLTQLAAADPDGLAESLAVHGEQHRALAVELVGQARVQATGQPERLTRLSVLEPGGALAELATAPGLLLYDIESDPDARDDFLHGFVQVRRLPDGRWPGADPEAMTSWPYRPLLALQEHGDARLWQRLQALINGHRDWPLLHYGETERIALLRLARRQGASDSERASLGSRLLDVHARLRQHWRLPVTSYGLKAVAGQQGFQWSQRGADGARCLLWWRQWRRGWSGRSAGADREASRRLLSRIFQYNRDDNLATWAVVRWLLDQG